MAFPIFQRNLHRVTIRNKSMHKLVEKYCELPGFVRKPMWNIWHNLINRLDKNTETIFLNYGFHEPHCLDQLILNAEDEFNRYCIQLYHHVSNQTSLIGKRVAEIGCGRGGGASYVMRYLRPEKYTGIDISGTLIRFCNRFHRLEGLNFLTGDALNIPLTNQSVDAVINIESARCYGNIRKFFSEVRRILKPGGQFLFADTVWEQKREELLTQLRESGMKIHNSLNITGNILHALDQDHERRENMVVRLVPKPLRKSFREFAGTRDSERYRSFESGSMEYWSFLLENS